MVQNIIDVRNLSKSFDISSKEPGLKGTIKHFFKRQTKSLKVIKKNNEKKRNSNFIFDLLRGLNYENKYKVSELLNPINFFIWLVVSFKDIF